MSHYFADIHCHPAGWNFQRLRQTPAEQDRTQYHPWAIAGDDRKAAGKGKRSFRYSQCDFGTLLASDTRLVWASLYPFEKGFFDETLLGRKQRKSGDVTLLDWIQQGSMRISEARIEYLQSDRYDYYQELLLEYAFYQLADREEVELRPELIGQSHLGASATSGRYFLPRSGDELGNLAAQKGEIAVVLSVEGMHALGLGNPANRGKDVDHGELVQRIREMKGEAGTVWQHPIFSITLSHHFDNTLLGHAKSFPPISRTIFGQEKNMDKGLIRPEAHQMVLEWLGLDADLNDTGARRVLVDVKHMSAASRRYLYETVIKPYNALNPSRKIPVIASHMGYSGMCTLQEQVAYAPKENNRSLRDGFLAWNINLSAEDVAVVVESGGLIGVSLDQRILGINRPLLGVFNLPKRNDIRSLVRTLEYMVAAGLAAKLAPEACWRSLSIGSDFGGYIDPVNPYSTALAFPQMRLDLQKGLSDLQKKRPELFGSLRAEEAVNQVCYQNAVRFTLKHYPTPKHIARPKIIV